MPISAVYVGKWRSGEAKISPFPKIRILKFTKNYRARYLSRVWESDVTVVRRARLFSFVIKRLTNSLYPEDVHQTVNKARFSFNFRTISLRFKFLRENKALFPFSLLPPLGRQTKGEKGGGKLIRGKGMSD